MPFPNYENMTGQETKITLGQARDYFYGRCSASEEMELLCWFADNANTPEADNLLLSLFEEMRVDDPVFAQEAFRQFCMRIGYPAAPKMALPRNRMATVIRWTQRVAAAVVFPLLVVFSTLYLKNARPQDWGEMLVPLGQRSKLELSDGTLLWLNSGTRVTYPANFSGRQRKIFIDGEVFAEIAHDQRHPFIISAGDVEVKVLGTKFNMRAYTADPSVEVALVDGSVSFDVNSTKCNEEVLMARNDVVTYDRLTGRIERGLFQSDNYRSRAHGGGFYFFNEPLNSIVLQLSRSFDRKIIITDTALEQVRFYAFFTDNESLDRILNSFNPDKKILIRDEGGTIYLSLTRK